MVIWMASAWALELVHVPATEAQAGESVKLVVSTDDIAAMPGVELTYRSGGAWRTLGFGPDDSGEWVALIPGSEVRGPTLEYYIVSPAGAHFASATQPWRVAVATEDLQTRGERELARYDGQRSLVEGWYRGIDHGADGELTDATWMAGMRFVYRPLTQIRAMEFGFVRMRGEALEVAEVDQDGFPVFGQDINPDARPNVAGRTWNQGLDWGYADLEVPFSERFSVSGRLILGGNDAGFTAGGRLAVRVGAEPQVYGRGWIGFVGGTGVDTGFEMHWDTVPYVPMFASIEVTNWPNNGPWGVLLSYGISVPLGPHADANLRVGYQGRTSDLGGIGLGGGLSWSF